MDGMFGDRSVRMQFCLVDIEIRSLDTLCGKKMGKCMHFCPVVMDIGLGEEVCLQRYNKKLVV